jgi:LPXTG-motif cell wall-anchored protein
MKRFIGMIGLFIMGLPALLMAQDQGTYIDNLGAQDSSYMDEAPLVPVEQASGPNTVVIVIIAVVVIAAVAFFLLKKKKK